MKTLDEDMQNLIKRPVSLEELAEMSRMFSGAINCLIKCIAEAKDEGGNFNESIDERAGRRTLPSRPKYTPFRLREAQGVDCYQNVPDYREFNPGQAQRIYAND